jgi:beta-galactosidase
VFRSGVLNPVECEPGGSVVVKLPIGKISRAGESWLRVSFHTRTNNAWTKAGYEVAWQQMQLETKSPHVEQKERKDLPKLKRVENGDVLHIVGADFSVSFSRDAGTLTSLKFGEHEILLQKTNEVAGPILQLFRAPTDNDKGFGKWLARDWREAGLDHTSRRVNSFQVSETKTQDIQVSTMATTSTTNGGYRLQTTWTIHRNGEVEMDNHFEPFGTLPSLPRIGVVMRAASEFENLHWYGRGPWENYSDRKQSADIGIYSSTVTEQFVPYVRPQENGNKEDVRWLAFTDTNGIGLLVTAEETPIAFSALHFTAADLASAKHNFELKPRPEIILSLDVKNCGLGNGSCGPGVLERHAVPPRNYRLHLRFSQCGPGSIPVATSGRNTGENP